LLGGLSLALALARPQGTALDGTSVEPTSLLPLALWLYTARKLLVAADPVQRLGPVGSPSRLHGLPIWPRTPLKQ